MTDVMLEIKKTCEELGRAVKEQREANDLRLSAIEKKAGAAELTEKVEKLSKTIDGLELKKAELEKEWKGRMDSIETALKRVGSPRDPKTGEELPADWAEVKKAYREWLTKGRHSQDGKEFNWDQKSLSVRSDPDGGFLVSSDMSGRIIQRVFETSPLRQFASVQTINSDKLEGSYDLDEVDSGWVGETQSRPETTTAKIGRWAIPVHEQYANPRCSQQLLDDANNNPEQWLANKVGDKFARRENTAFVSGDGINKPRGFLTYPNGTTLPVNGGAPTIEQLTTVGSLAFAGDDLLDLTYLLKAPYRTRAAWAMARQTIGAVRKLKDGFGQYIWTPGLQAGQPSSLLGYAIAELADMPATGVANALPIAFGDWSEAYQIVDRPGIRILRDPYTAKPFVQFYSTKRTGGDVVNFEALKILKIKP